MSVFKFARWRWTENWTAVAVLISPGIFRSWSVLVQSGLSLFPVLGLDFQALAFFLLVDRDLSLVVWCSNIWRVCVFHCLNLHLVLWKTSCLCWLRSWGLPAHKCSSVSHSFGLGFIGEQYAGQGLFQREIASSSVMTLKISF